MATFRSKEERDEIVRAIIAESNPPPLSSFALNEKEELFFRARTARAVKKLVQKTSAFKAYYELPTERPFSKVIMGAGLVIALCLIAFIWVHRTAGSAPPYPIYAALLSIVALAAGWVITSEVSHRNTIRQNTNTVIFARFAQAPFGEALHRFHDRFGYDYAPYVTFDLMSKLRASDKEEDHRVAAATVYLLNYFEFIAAGVLRGDLDARIIRENIRGVICYYYDKCQFHIETANRRDHRTYEHLRKIRTSYREI